MRPHHRGLLIIFQCAGSQTGTLQPQSTNGRTTRSHNSRVSCRTSPPRLRRLAPFYKCPSFISATNANGAWRQGAELYTWGCLENWWCDNAGASCKAAWSAYSAEANAIIKGRSDHALVMCLVRRPVLQHLYCISWTGYVAASGGGCVQLRCERNELCPTRNGGAKPFVLWCGYKRLSHAQYITSRVELVFPSLIPF